MGVTNKTKDRLQRQFVTRCNELSVPNAIRYAAWHQVYKQRLTMIVYSGTPNNIHVWFRIVKDLE